ncbi:MAG: ATP-binding protein, partial [Ktedonobacterales bacterium]
SHAPSVGDPSAAMFSHIRRQLTLQYSGVLAVILILSSLILYFSVQSVLLGQVNEDLTSSAQQIASNWQQNPPNDPRVLCYVPPSAGQLVPYIACYNSAVGGAPLTESTPHEFWANPSLVQKALNSSSGQAGDTIHGDNGLGEIQRYALVVRDPDNHATVLGVVMVGEQIEGQERSLYVLAILLLVVGLLTLLGAALGGLWLSARALAPARLAFTRQQAFIADASHELRTPLTLLRADAEVLLRGRNRLNADDAELLDDIVSETAHMSALTTNLLTVARLDAGALQVGQDLVDLREVAAQTLHRASALAHERNITLRGLGLDGQNEGANMEDGIPALVIGDHALLAEVALILVDNALKYNRPGGSVDVTVAQVNGQVKLEVHDSGIGIPPEYLAQLGERFYRVDKARSRESGGAGLGLSIARGIAVAHHGSLTLASDVEHGTTATLTLPAAPLPRDAA